ncbi:putative transmembrane protein [Gregarina niphandrodes]|uniref:Transmembrane protein n=1 Tax=Gregarina niphandrodes TaxID=110365 RepID=A0A023B7K4_GRENI|nr:putative transmembrane protein [Gregarina niphandrodes]EZG67525.1 putative transmembrane protein [Gregarina niphandrodes]|eukprot:XP_011130216.1 putative transmembrane protein [Gregarina niphandrodes]
MTSSSKKGFTKQIAIDVEDNLVKPPLSPHSVNLGLLVFLTVAWVFSFILSASTLTSSAYVRWKTYDLHNNVTAVSCVPDPINDFAIIHIDCPIKSKHPFKPPSEFSSNLPEFEGVFYDMMVEMYQAHFSRFSVGGNGEWYDHLLDGGTIDYFPAVPGSGRSFAPDVYAGGFKIDTESLNAFHGKKQLPLHDDGVYDPSPQRPPPKISNRNTRVYENTLYTGDPFRPRLGDVRITFYGSAATHVSLIGVQEPSSYLWQFLPHRRITGFRDVFAPEGMDEHHLIIREGDYTSDELIRAYERQNNAFHSIHWWSLAIFGFTTALLAVCALRKWRHNSQAARQPLVLTALVGVLIALGTVLFVASVPNMFGMWYLGAVQALAGLLVLAAAGWMDQRATEGLQYLPLRHVPVMKQSSQTKPQSAYVAI